MSCWVQALHSVLSSWVSRRFFGGCAVLFPMVVTVYITWWFLTFFDNFFSVRRACNIPSSSASHIIARASCLPSSFSVCHHMCVRC